MDKYLRNLEAMLIVTDGTALFVLTGAGDVLEPEHDIAAIGSGGNFALAAARGLMEVVVKNRFAVGDTLECVLPGGNFPCRIERMENAEGEPIAVAPGSGHRVWLPLPATALGAFVARCF